MPKREVTFKQLDREHRREVTRDADRLRTGKTTQAALQAENSILPPNTRVRIPDFVEHARKTFLRE